MVVELFVNYNHWCPVKNIVSSLKLLLDNGLVKI